MVEEEEDNSVEAAMPTALIRVLLLQVYTMEASQAQQITDGTGKPEKPSSSISGAREGSKSMEASDGSDSV